MTRREKEAGQAIPMTACVFLMSAGSVVSVALKMVGDSTHITISWNSENLAKSTKNHQSNKQEGERKEVKPPRKSDRKGARRKRSDHPSSFLSMLYRILCISSVVPLSTFSIFLCSFEQATHSCSEQDEVNRQAVMLLTFFGRRLTRSAMPTYH